MWSQTDLQVHQILNTFCKINQYCNTEIYAFCCNLNMSDHNDIKSLLNSALTSGRNLFSAASTDAKGEPTTSPETLISLLPSYSGTVCIQPEDEEAPPHKIPAFITASPLPQSEQSHLRAVNILLPFNNYL